MEREQLITLVEQSRSGDAKAMEDLLQYAHTPVSYQCRKMLRNPQDAEDLTQEVLVTIYTKLDTLQESAVIPRPSTRWPWGITLWTVSVLTAQPQNDNLQNANKACPFGQVLFFLIYRFSTEIRPHSVQRFHGGDPLTQCNISYNQSKQTGLACCPFFAKPLCIRTNEF